jgi:hypothetical protein
MSRRTESPSVIAVSVSEYESKTTVLPHEQFTPESGVRVGIVASQLVTPAVWVKLRPKTWPPLSQCSRRLVWPRAPDPPRIRRRGRFSRPLAVCSPLAGAARKGLALVAAAPSMLASLRSVRSMTVASRRAFGLCGRSSPSQVVSTLTESFTPNCEVRGIAA